MPLKFPFVLLSLPDVIISILLCPYNWLRKAGSHEYVHSGGNVSPEAELDVNTRRKVIGRKEYSFYLGGF